MPQAKVIRPFKGVEDGKVYPRTFVVGEKITGDLAHSEVEAGRAEWTEKKSPPQNKAITEAPKNKHSSASQPDQASQQKTAKKRRRSKQ